MEPLSDFIRAAARELGRTRQLPLAGRDEIEAARVVLKVAFDERCPRCARGAAPIGPRSARCEGGHAFSITRGTALHRTKIALPLWLSAIWHLHVDRQSVSARTFSLRYALRHATAWELMHRVRRAFIVATPRERGLEIPLARARRRQFANASRDGRELVLVEPGDVACPDVGAPSREGAPILGRARAWLTEVYCGVTARYLHLYLAEFAARFGRPPNVA